jgi:hypothetical protein
VLHPQLCVLEPHDIETKNRGSPALVSLTSLGTLESNDFPHH